MSELIQTVLYIIGMACLYFAWYGIGYNTALREIDKKLSELLYEQPKPDEEKCDG